MPAGRVREMWLCQQANCEKGTEIACDRKVDFE